MHRSEPASNAPALGLSKLLSVLLLATGMLLATTMPLKASWLWVLAPIALLFVLDAMGGVAGKVERAAIPFYGALLGMALAFHFFGPSTASTPAPVATHAHAQSGCGAGGCGTSGGCGTGGCGASAGGACGCGSRKSAKSSTAGGTKAAYSTAPPTVALRPVTPTQPKRKFNVQLPPPPAQPQPPASGSPAAAQMPVPVPAPR